MKPSSAFVLSLFLVIGTVPPLSAQSTIPPPPDSSNQPAIAPIQVPFVNSTTSSGASCNQDNRCGLIAGASLYYLRPYMSGNTAYLTVTNPGLPNAVSSSTPFQWNLDPAFAGWIGWTWDSGFGVRARYFQFDNPSTTSTLTNGTTPGLGNPGVSQTTVNPPFGNLPPLSISTGGTAFGSPGTVLTSPGLTSANAGPDHLSFSSGLTVRSLDAEALYGFGISNWTFLASAGGRYMELNQNYQATLVNTGNGLPVREFQQLTYGRNFSGGGLTGALQGNYNFAGTGFSLFANGRASFIVGEISENESYLQRLSNPGGLIPGVPASQTINPQANRTSSGVIPVLEFELGAEYSISLSHSRLFFRAAAVNQSYFDAGNATSSSGNMNLFGIQGTIGWNY